MSKTKRYPSILNIVNPIYAVRAWNKIQKDASVNTIPRDYIPTGTIQSPHLQNQRYPEDLTSLWLKGPSGVGKTTWALTYSNKPALFVRHLDTLAEFRNGFHTSIIFDDMSFLHLPRQAQLELVDRYHPQQIHIRYRKVDLPAGIQKIFLSNDRIFDLSDEAIARRITFINLFVEIGPFIDIIN